MIETFLDEEKIDLIFLAIHRLKIRDLLQLVMIYFIYLFKDLIYGI